MKRICVVCGKEFETTHSTKITCSKMCSLERHAQMNKARSKAKHTTKHEVCRMCGETFLVVNANQKYCPICRKKRMSGQNPHDIYLRRPMVSKVCIVCGREFTTKEYRQNTCSPECKIERMRTYQREYKRPHVPTDERVDAYKRCPEDPQKLDKTLERLKREGKSYAQAQREETIRIFARVII